MMIVSWFLWTKEPPTIFTLICGTLEFLLEAILIWRITNSTFSILPLFIYFSFCLLSWSNEIL